MLVGRLPQLSPRLPARKAARHGGEVERQFRFVRRALGLRSVFMQIGAEDCALARRVAGDVERAYAVARERAQGAPPQAPNLVQVFSEGGALPVPEGSVDVAFSQGLLERLHPAAALEHLGAVRRALARGGAYFCITANRFCGASPAAKEYRYSAAELRENLLEAGFRSVRFYCRVGSRHAALPYALLRLTEGFARALPYRLRKRLPFFAVHAKAMA